MKMMSCDWFSLENDESLLENDEYLLKNDGRLYKTTVLVVALRGLQVILC